MVDVATILSMLGSVAAVVGPLTALLWDRLNRLEDRINNVERDLTEIKVNIYELSRSMVGFSNTLIDVLAIKSVITSLRPRHLGATYLWSPSPGLSITRRRMRRSLGT